MAQQMGRKIAPAQRKKPLRPGVMRLLRAGAIAGLHSLGKGANRTPPDRAVRRSSGRTAGLLAAATGFFGGLQRERTDRQDGKDFTP